MLASILDHLYPGAFRAGRISVSTIDGQERITTWAVPNVPKPTEAAILAREAEWRAAKEPERPWERAEEQLGRARQRVLAAVVVRLSDSWAGLTAQEKARINAVLNNAGQRIVEAMRSG